MPVPIIPILVGGSVVASLLLEVYDRMKGDPELDVQGALDQLQREQLSAFESQEASKVGRAQERQAQQGAVAQRGVTDLTMLRSGLYDDQLGLTPQAGEITKTFQERLSPRRLGDLSDMTRDIVGGA